MELFNLLISVFSLLLLVSGAQCSSSDRRRGLRRDQDHGFRPTKLFVFGDSYVDTGNIRKSFASSWKEPYGTTFPGKPAGRFSDGRVLTDYVARTLRLKSPVSYEWRKYGGTKVRRGMNFAYGGSGVFDTLGAFLPNMTTQIDYLENLINSSVYTKLDIQSSAVLVCVAGNDYGVYIQTNNTIQGLLDFIPRVVNQVTLNLQRIIELGARKIVVTALPPLGCLPRMTRMSSFRQCNDTQNSAVELHNRLLVQEVGRLNNETSRSSILFLDLYTSFATTIDKRNVSTEIEGKAEFGSTLRPCCVGTCDGCSCGTVDGNGTKLYTVCSDPESAFFWDSSHPTEAGWSTVYGSLKSSIEDFF